MQSLPTSTIPASAFTGLIGISQQDITPPVGIYTKNWGAALHEQAEGIHRPLSLTCVTLQASREDSPFVIIGLDLGWWKNSADEKRLRQQLLDAFALPAQQLLLCLSHTHAGPSTCLDDQAKPGGELIAPYLQYVADQGIRAIREALQKAVPDAVLTWNYGECNLAVNRDFPDPNGDRILTGYAPTIEADNTLLVGRISTLNGRLLGTIVNYACHPTTLAWENKLISPDYIGAMREVIEGQTHAPCLFLQGASGELSPARQFTNDLALTDRYGQQLGYATLATLAAMERPAEHLRYKGVVESGASLAIWEPDRYTISSTLRAEMVKVTYPLKDFPLLDELYATLHTTQDPVQKERIWRKIGIRNGIGNDSVATIPLWIWRIGTAILVGQPNEPYSCYQTALREAFPTTAIAVMNLVNGSYGYLPPPALYDHVAYPVWQTPFASDALAILQATTHSYVTQLLSNP